MLETNDEHDIPYSLHDTQHESETHRKIKHIKTTYLIQAKILFWTDEW